MAAVFAVKTDGIAGQKPLHNGDYLRITGAKRQVRVVGDQCPGQPWRTGFYYVCAQTDKKLGTVGRGAE